MDSVEGGGDEVMRNGPRRPALSSGAAELRPRWTISGPPGSWTTKGDPASSLRRAWVTLTAASLRCSCSRTPRRSSNDPTGPPVRDTQSAEAAASLLCRRCAVIPAGGPHKRLSVRRKSCAQPLDEAKRVRQRHGENNHCQFTGRARAAPTAGNALRVHLHQSGCQRPQGPRSGAAAPLHRSVHSASSVASSTSQDGPTQEKASSSLPSPTSSLRSSSTASPSTSALPSSSSVTSDLLQRVPTPTVSLR